MHMYSDLTAEDSKKEMCGKLCLWHTPTLAPIFTHHQLEPIMTSINFSPIIKGPSSTSTASASPGRENDGVNGEQPEVTSMEWRKYTFIGKHPKKGWNFYYKKRHRPRLPYPRVDGLHLKSYLEFLCDVECFLDPLVVANMFHIRAMPIDSRDEIHKTMFKEIKNFVLHPEIDGNLRYFYFYRVGTLGNTSEERYGLLKASVGNDISKYVRKDGTRKIEEDERDDSSDFVCLIDDQKTENLKASVSNNISKYVRKDGTRKIEEDERDDSSNFVCLIDNQKTENLKASVGNGNDISKYLRKDGTRIIKEDERDDSSDFVCLIDDQTINFVKDGVSW